MLWSEDIFVSPPNRARIRRMQVSVYFVTRDRNLELFLTCPGVGSIPFGCVPQIEHRCRHKW
jgi:hypothetical protein